MIFYLTMQRVDGLIGSNGRVRKLAIIANDRLDRVFQLYVDQIAQFRAHARRLARSASTAYSVSGEIRHLC